MNTQTGISATADFEQSTWTFEMTEDFTVSAGEFRIVPINKYDEVFLRLENLINNFPKTADIQYIKDDLESILKNW